MVVPAHHFKTKISKHNSDLSVVLFIMKWEGKGGEMTAGEVSAE